MKLEEKMQGEAMLVNLKHHYETVIKEMPAKQAVIANTPKLGAVTLVNMRKQYMDLQDTAHFLQSMHDALDRALHPEKFESRILTPNTQASGMKIIN